MLFRSLVQTLAPLSPVEREQYARGLQKYAHLDPVEKVRFLQGWERWKTMPDSERKVWRQLATHLPPVPPPPVPTVPQLKPPGTAPKVGNLAPQDLGEQWAKR